MKIFRLLCALLAVALIACEEPNYGSTASTTIGSLGRPAENEIWFTTTDGKVLLSLNEDAFNTPIVEVIYDEGGLNIIRFEDAVTTIGEEAFSYCHNIFNLSTPNSVTTIGERAFFDCKNMECLTLGESLRSCGADAFDGCYNLYSLHIPSIQSWCRIAFASKSANPLYYTEHFIIQGEKISELNIPEGTTEISDYAFVYCSRLKSVSIPWSLLHIGKSAFEGCDNISKVKIASLSAWCNIEFEDEMANPLSIAKQLYKGEAKISNVELDGVAEIHPYAFINCTSIVSFKASDRLSAIGTDAFRNCSSLVKVELGSGISQIGKQAFMNCKGLKSVTCKAQTPPTLGNNDVFSYNHEARKFYVPTTAVEAYKADGMWSRYGSSIEEMKN